MEFVSQGIRERYACLALNLVRFSASDLEHIGRVGRHGAKLKNILLRVRNYSMNCLSDLLWPGIGCPAGAWGSFVFCELSLTQVKEWQEV